MRTFAEQSALRTFEHFDTLNVKGITAKLVVWSNGRRHRRTIEVHTDGGARDVITDRPRLRRDTANDVTVFALCVARHVESGDGVEDVGNAYCAEVFDHVVRDRANGLWCVHQVGFAIGRGNDDFFDCSGFGLL